MLNRNERKSLRRSKRYVSWLCVLSLFLIIWIRNLYSNIDFTETENHIINIELDDAMIELDKSKNKIDSLVNIINSKKEKDIIKKIKSPYKKSEYTDSSLILIKDTSKLNKLSISDSMNTKIN